MLAPLARACVRHKKLVIGIWVGLLAVFIGLSGAIGADYKTDFKLPDSETKQVFDLLQQNLTDFMRELNSTGLTGVYSLGQSDFLAARAAKGPLPEPGKYVDRSYLQEAIKEVDRK